MRKMGTFQTLVCVVTALTWSGAAFCGEIHEAAAKGDIEKVRVLLKEEPSLVNEESPLAKPISDRGTPMHWAASCGSVELLELLVANGGSIDAQNRWGWTPLLWAINFEQKEAVQWLVAHKADVNVRAKNEGQRPIILAAIKGDKWMVEFLIVNGADIQVKDAGGETAFQKAVRYNRKQVVELLVHNKADVNAAARNTWSSLDIAVEEGNKEMAEWLLARGAKINAKGSDGWSPLYKAIMADKKDMAEFLLQHGANINIRTTAHMQEWTPLHYAASQGKKELVLLLLSHRANVGVKDYESKTPLDLVESNRYIAVVELLNCPLSDGEIFRTTKFGDTDKLKILVQSKLKSVAQKDARGHTSLHWAAMMGQKDAAVFLINNRGDVNAADNFGWTPLHYTAAEGEKLVVEVLLKNKADVKTTDNDGGTALKRAIERGHKEIADLLRKHGAKE